MYGGQLCDTCDLPYGDYCCNSGYHGPNTCSLYGPGYVHPSCECEGNFDALNWCGRDKYMEDQYCNPGCDYYHNDDEDNECNGWFDKDDTCNTGVCTPGCEGHHCCDPDDDDYDCGCGHGCGCNCGSNCGCNGWNPNYRCGGCTQPGGEPLDCLDTWGEGEHCYCDEEWADEEWYDIPSCDDWINGESDNKPCGCYDPCYEHCPCIFDDKDEDW